MAIQTLTRRRAELADQLARRALQTPDRTVLITGAPGVGKTLVAAEVQRRMRTQDSDHPDSRVFTLQVSPGVVPSGDAQTDRRWLRRQLLRAAREARLERVDLATIERGGDDRAILHALEALSEPGLVLRLENADGLDPASAALIAEAADAAAIALLITTRDRAALPEPLYERTRRSDAVSWRLAALDGDETREIVDAHLGGETHWQAAAQLHALTAGNPELLDAVLADLDDADGWRVVRGIWLLRDGVSVGHRLREHLRRLLRSRDDAEVELLLAIAMAGDLPVRSVEVLSAPAVVDRSLADGLLQQHDGFGVSGQRLSVSPEVTRQTLLDVSGRAARHRALRHLDNVPAVLRSAWGPNSEAEVIRQRLDLEPETVSAAELLAAVGAFVEGGALDASVPLLQQVIGSDELSSAELDEARFQLAYALLRTGHEDGARAMVGQLGDPLTAAFAGLWFDESETVHAGVDAAAVRLLNAVRGVRQGQMVDVSQLDALAADPAAPSRLRWLACAYALLAGLESGVPLVRVERVESAIAEMSVQASRIDRWIANDLTHAHVLGLLSHRRPWAAQSAAMVLNGMAVTSVSDANASLGLGVIASETGDLRAGRRMLRQGLVLLDDSDPTGLAAYAESALEAVQLQLDEEPPPADDLSYAAEPRRGVPKREGARSYGVSRMFRMDIVRRDLLTHAMRTWRADRIAGSDDDSRQSMLGDWDAVRAAYDAAIEVETAHRHAWAALQLLHDRARLLPGPVTTESAELAERQADELDGELAHAMVLFVHGRALGDAAMIGRAAEAFGAVGRIVPQAEAVAARAVLLREQGQRSESDAELWRMHDLLLATGPVNTPLLNRVRWNDPRFSHREQQIAPLVARHLTNREIAAHLVLSPRTVEGHVQRMLLRLGIDHRARIIGDSERPLPGQQED
ncbi:AAA family ATPase [Pseudoclavibacter sp. CFCC 14310]|uniref:LuxR C-terminal-related transcriptional regulator n=1 Tax=Pseudoclavibacter sp. CFCC 14310 TaxID=2615180 RepID=UPI0013015A3C|nr:AAA family ATPase [Pseudoclavibacter sp. CFCC 14310]KAB1643775.1 AAA family ATPase [Pseudoclavibacter sp. CFCC 14310]